MERQWIILGYYICKYAKCPEYLKNLSDKILSVSDCLCTHEPQIFLCHGWKPNGDDKDYIAQCFTSEQQYIKMSAEISELLDEGLFCTDGRFLNKEDALHFYKEYFNGEEYRLVAVRMDHKYYEKICDDLEINKYALVDKLGENLGCDIVGWDISGFHSFLCNSLNKGFTDIRFNSYGLIDDEYTVAEEIATKIQGQGEPVEWIPIEYHYVC